jgi:hypothetical protein
VNGTIWRPELSRRGAHSLALSIFVVTLIGTYIVISGLPLLPWLVQCPNCTPPVSFNTPPPHLQIVSTYLTIAALVAVVIRPFLAKCPSPTSSSFGLWSLGFSLLTPAILLGIGFYYLFLVIEAKTSASAKEYFLALRYAKPGNGYSPFPPLFFASLGLACWAASRVRGSGMLEIAANPEVEADDGKSVSFLGLQSASLGDLVQREIEVHSRFSRFFPSWPVGLLLLIFLAAAMVYCFVGHSDGYLSFEINRTVEGAYFDYSFIFLFSVAYCTISFSFLRFVLAWRAFGRLLRRLSWHPLREACAELGASPTPPPLGEGQRARRVTGMPRLSLGSSMPTFTALEFSIEQAEKLVQQTQFVSTVTGSLAADPTFALRVRQDSSQLFRFLTATKSQLAIALEADATGDFIKSKKGKLAIQKLLARMSGVVVNILEPDWRFPDGHLTTSENDIDRWRRFAGLFLASRVLDYNRHIMSQLRNLLGFSMAGFVVLLMAASFYPFPRSDTILRFSWMMLLAAVLISVWIFFQMNKDRILSLLSGGTPGKIDWNAGLVGHLALYALLPIVTILGIRFPATFNGVISAIASILPGTGHT